MRVLGITFFVMSLISIVACGQNEGSSLSIPAEGKWDSGFLSERIEATMPSEAPDSPPWPLPPQVPASVTEFIPQPSISPHSKGNEPQSVRDNFADLASNKRLIVRTVDISITVSNISESLETVSLLAEEMSGWVISSTHTQKHRGFISIRVPVDKLNTAILKLRQLAVDTKSDVRSSRDVTDEYVDTSARYTNLQATENALLELMNRSETVEDALNVQKSLTQVREDIERLKGQIKFLEQTSAFSLLNVTMELEPSNLDIDAGPDQTKGVNNPIRFRATFIPPENIIDFSFTWNFGDGSPPITSNQTAPTENEKERVTATVTHIYNDERDSPFIAQIKLMGTGEGGVAEGEDTLMIDITEIPVIEVFAGKDILVEEDEEVELRGSFTRPIDLKNVEFRWDFGDGTTMVTGLLSEGITNASATHTYLAHRPTAYKATLTITAQSSVGEVRASNSVYINVIERKGFTVVGWSATDQIKTAMRTLSAIVQGIATLLIWIGILSPFWLFIGLMVSIIWRRAKRRRQGQSDANSPKLKNPDASTR